ncbi:MAG: T9SS type A sorting domain-containing protein [Flavobacteriales bacterium]|nr:T9SS type A sorting domain-containing protein [Flavobacteriales bacterium]
MPSKFIVPLFLLSFFSAVTNAQTEWLWATSMGDTGTDAGQAIAIDTATGDVFTAGWFEGTVDFDPGTDLFNLTSAGGQDIFISKLDASGNFLWAAAMGGESQDAAYSIAFDPAFGGSLYCTGWFSETSDFDPDSSEEFNLVSAGLTDVFIAKLDNTGGFVWAIAAGSLEYDGARSLAVDPAGSGDLYATGYFAGTVDFDPGEDEAILTAASDTDIFITKLDASGNLLWAKAMGGSNDDTGYAIALDPAAGGSVYTTGSFAETVDFNPGAGIFNLVATGGVDVFISKLDTQGNFVWAKSMGGITSTVSYSIAIDHAGGGAVYTTGAFRETVDFDPGQGTFNLISAGWRDVFISKLDSAGDFIWAKAMGGVENDKSFAIAISPTGSGHVYTTGEFVETADFDPGAAEYNLTSAGERDLFVSKLDSTGTFVWALAVGEANSEYSQAMALDTLANVFITGYFTSPTVMFGAATLSNADNSGFYSDVFISRLDHLIVGIENIENNDGIAIYPNPATHQFTVIGTVVKSIEVYDLLGKEVFKTNCTTALPIGIGREIQTATWPRGIYFLKVFIDEGNPPAGQAGVMKKVVIE